MAEPRTDNWARDRIAAVGGALIAAVLVGFYGTVTEHSTKLATIEQQLKTNDRERDRLLKTAAQTRTKQWDQITSLRLAVARLRTKGACQCRRP